MRILDIGPWITYPPERGRAVRAYNLLRRLADRHDVRQWGRGKPQLRRDARLLEEVPVTPMFRVYRCRYPLAERARERLFARGPGGLSGAAARRLACPPRLRELLAWAHVVVAEDPAELALARLERPGARFVFVAHDVGSTDAVSSSGHDLVGEAVAVAELVVAVSAADRMQLIERYGLDPETVVEVPNGADVEQCHPVDKARRAALRAELGLPPGPLAVFAGTASPANRAALAWLRRLAAASGRYVFAVVGSVGAPERDGRLIVTGPVADMRPYLQAADAAILPIEHGSGTRIKLFEALACALPAVVFPEALRGTEVEPGVHALVCEKSEKALLGALESLARDPARAAQLGAAGRSFVVARHSWNDLAARLDDALRSRFDPEYGRSARHTYASAPAGS
jgi:glycosyltransferase involved in cell wall biosynthesis